MKKKYLCDDCRNKAPFEVGDLICKDTLFGYKTRIVNRIFFTGEGWEMLVDDYQWKSPNNIVEYCKKVSVCGWYKI